MIIAGYEYADAKPFKNVYLTGLVRDSQGRKMSKSLGNSPEPLGLIEKFGADGVRVGLLLSASAGNDILFDEELCNQGKAFTNKIWNAFKLIKGWEVSETIPQPESSKVAIEWYEAKLQQTLLDIEDNFEKYRLSEALMATYKLVWDDFCAWYLEIIKPEFIDGKSQPIDKNTYEATINFLESLLKIMHPWMPFITEEIWHLTKDRTEKECIIVAEWPKNKTLDQEVLKPFEVLKEVVTQVRNIRQQKNISPKEKLEVKERSDVGEKYSSFDSVIVKLANLSSYSYTKEKVEGAFGFMVLNAEFFVPLTGNINVAEEKERLTKELEYNKGFLKSVQVKLSNERFVANAKPEIIDGERKKESDALNKIKSIEAQLASL
jgi:valyl-tRNA synthetase